jgi:hypothetical protein
MRSKEFLKRISAQASVLILRQRKKMENYKSANIFDHYNILLLSDYQPFDLQAGSILRIFVPPIFHYF